jgi:hypothetical protein
MIVDLCAYLGDWPTYELPHRTAGGLLSLWTAAALAPRVSPAGGISTRHREANEHLSRRGGPPRPAVACGHRTDVAGCGDDVRRSAGWGWRAFPQLPTHLDILDARC